MGDSLLLAHPDDTDLRAAIIDARLALAKSKDSLDEYKKYWRLIQKTVPLDTIYIWQREKPII